ncbi:MAG: hypothetical protein ABI618_11180, partial [Nitrospirota bacterium]
MTKRPTTHRLPYVAHPYPHQDEVSRIPDSMAEESAKNIRKGNLIYDSVSSIPMRLPLTGSQHFQMSQHSRRNIV